MKRKSLQNSLGLFAFVIMMICSKAALALPEKQDTLKSEVLNGLSFRCIGPAYCSGRIADFAVNPAKPFEYYVSVASGHVWRTTNAGNTFQPIFDKQGSYSIGPVAVDPNNPHVVWVGTGEYNSQRSVGYGDGVYKTEDGGQSWKNMGLKASEHIGRILIDPRNPDVVYVAAQGPLWGPGGERGLYKTADGGKTWKQILFISENTGVNDVYCDPRNPDVLYCSSYQRRRHVFTLVDGGPESAVYKSVDAGITWKKINSGLPEGEMGRIGLNISPVNPDVLYAVVEAAGDKGGFFRSTNRGASWEKRSGMKTSSPQYYNRIYCDPKDVDKVYSMDTYTQLTVDGGKTWHSLGNKHRHVDDHALWIDPADTRHLLIGGDGGIYETWDAADNWEFKPNLPVTQFYRVSVDNDLPFYNVYGGTQDNASMGGPSRTISSAGIVNDDWWMTHYGDGFETQVDPKDPNVVYAQAQHGNLVRCDRQSREELPIQPQPPPGEAYRWNWDSPLLISPHSHTRLYFAANKLFRSDDRGSSWKVISPDLTRQIDRNTLPVFGKIQSIDAVAKNASTSYFGNIVALTESPQKEDLIYVGTDDGLVQMTDNGGANWYKTEKFPGVPVMTYVSCLLASNHDPDVVYAAFDNHKNADYKPYILKSSDKGKSWKAITANLPERGSVYSLAEDPAKPGLLFAGTEFGLFVSLNDGESWTAMKNGLPTIAIKDIAIQPRENDLVLATFGRGFYICDDYSCLRQLNEEVRNKVMHLFPVKDAVMFVPRSEKFSLGETYYGGQNPPVGAVFTYYMKEGFKSLKETRQIAEKEAMKKGEAPSFPNWDQVRAENTEEKSFLLFTVYDEQGAVVRKLRSAGDAGIQRLIWDFRYPSVFPVNLKPSPTDNSASGLLALPGKYSVSVSKSVNGVLTELGEKQVFNCNPLFDSRMNQEEREEMAKFNNKISELAKAIHGASREMGKMTERVKLIREALNMTTDANTSLESRAKAIQDELYQVSVKMNGDPVLGQYNENQPPSVLERINDVIYGIWECSSAPTQTMKDGYETAGSEFVPLLAKLRQIQEIDLKDLEQSLDRMGSPYTPGRLPVWKK